MNPLNRFFYRSKLSTRMLIGFTAIVALMLALFYTLVVTRATGAMRKILSDSLAQSVEQTAFRLDRIFGNAEAASSTVFINQQLQQRLVESSGNDPVYTQFGDYVELRNIVDNIKTLYTDLEFEIYSRNGALFNAEERVFFDEALIESEVWYGEAVEANGRAVWTGDMSRSGYGSGVRASAVSLVRVLKDSNAASRLNRIGILKINIAKSILEELMRGGPESGYGMELYLLDGEGAVVADTGTIDRAVFPEFQTGDGDADQWIFLTRALSVSGWTLVGRVAQDGEYLSEVTHIEAQVWWTFLAIVVFYALFAYLSSRSLSRRALKIVSVIEDIRRRSFSEHIPIRYRDELSSVEEQINLLIDRIHGLLSEVSAEERAKRKAQLQALQAQINPHFLYNALDSINWMAIERGDMDISQATTRLGKFLRLSLAGGHELVALKEEIEQVRVYLMIQQVRMKDRLRLSIDVSEEALECEAVKLILQPFVENAIRHGFSRMGDQGAHLYIRGEIRKGRVVVAIEDDGAGFELAEVRERDMPPRSGYGIENVRERLKLYYDKEADVAIASRPGSGTTVTIYWPATPFVRQKS